MLDHITITHLSHVVLDVAVEVAPCYARTVEVRHNRLQPLGTAWSSASAKVSELCKLLSIWVPPLHLNYRLDILNVFYCNCILCSIEKVASHLRQKTSYTYKFMYLHTLSPPPHTHTHTSGSYFLTVLCIFLL